MACKSARSGAHRGGEQAPCLFLASFYTRERVPGRKPTKIEREQGKQLLRSSHSFLTSKEENLVGRRRMSMRGKKNPENNVMINNTNGIGREHNGQKERPGGFLLV